MFRAGTNALKLVLTLYRVLIDPLSAVLIGGSRARNLGVSPLNLPFAMDVWMVFTNGKVDAKLRNVLLFTSWSFFQYLYSGVNHTGTFNSRLSQAVSVDMQVRLVRVAERQTMLAIPPLR